MTRVIPARLGTADAIGAGLAAMVGAGVFAGLAPAAALAGRWLLVGMVIAALAAGLCGVCTADQCRAYPGPGSGYRYTREQLGRWPGRLAGGAYLVGRAAAAAALAGCFGAYAMPGPPTLAALAVLVAAVAVDATGLRVPRAVTRLLIVFVLLVLVIVVAVCFAIAPPAPTGVAVPAGTAGADDPAGLLPAAGVLFFAFLGFERITAPTSGEPEVSRRRLRMVIPVLLLVALGTYLAVGAAVLRQLGPARLALSPVPLRDALAAADGAALDPLLTVAALIGTLSALLVVVGGVRRTVDVMASGGDLPATAATPGHGPLPVPASVFTGVAGVLAVLLLPPGPAIELAATGALFYYAFTNASARLLPRADRAWPVRTACFGLGLSVLLGMTMPPVDLLVTAVGMVVGAALGPLVAMARRVRR